MSFDTVKYPGFWKHLVVGVCSSGLTIAATAFALGGAWSDQRAKVVAASEAAQAAVEAVESHSLVEGMHPTFSQAAEAEGRLSRLETQQQAIIDDVGEIKDDIKDVKRLLERRGP